MNELVCWIQNLPFKWSNGTSLRNMSTSKNTDFREMSSTISTLTVFKFSTHKFYFPIFGELRRRRVIMCCKLRLELEILLNVLSSNKWSESSQLNDLPWVKVWKCLAKGMIKKAIHFSTWKCHHTGHNTVDISSWLWSPIKT
jgi:hypothetical protein